VKRIGEALFGTVRAAVGLTLPTMLMLVYASVAFAQPADDQYGSPVDPVDPAVNAVSVLPDTGGPLLLLSIGAALFVAGVGLALRQRIVAGRRLSIFSA
jgi:hypothetical protein